MPATLRRYAAAEDDDASGDEEMEGGAVQDLISLLFVLKFNLIRMDT